MAAGPVPVPVVKDLNLDVQVMIGLDHCLCMEHTHMHRGTHTHLAGILPREQSIDVREQALASSQSLFSKQTQNTDPLLLH